MGQVSPNRRDPRRESGAALLVAVLLLAMLGVIGLASMETVTRDRQVAGFQNRARASLYAAEAGVSHATGLIRKNAQALAPGGEGALKNYKPAFPGKGLTPVVTLGADFPAPGSPSYGMDPAAEDPNNVAADSEAIRYIGRGDLRDYGFSAQEALGGTGAITGNNAAGSSINGNVRNPTTLDYYSRGNPAGVGFTRFFPGAACSNFTNHPQGDPVDPGASRTVAAPPAARLPDARQGVGRRLFGPGRVAGDAVRQPEDPPLKQADQFREGCLVAVPTPPLRASTINSAASAATSVAPDASNRCRSEAIT